MKQFRVVVTSIIFFCAVLTVDAVFAAPNKKTVDTPRVQVAILLDVSGSMDGLIEQAKSQLWGMMQTLSKATTQGQKPIVEIALYEYGRPSNGSNNHYIKKIMPFTTDLDVLSAKLFELKTSGGDEYCGAVLVQSLNELQWGGGQDDYKVIFIAGNESFRQGPIPFAQACLLAKQKGVVINTVYCGDSLIGIKEYWNQNGECGNGTYAVIDHNDKEDDKPAPQDSLIYVLNEKLNTSYVTYNTAGFGRAQLQRQMDAANSAAAKKAGIQRAAVKANKQAYRNSGWDLVDAYEEDSTVIDKVDSAYLPDTLKNKSKAAIKKYVLQKAADRAAIQQQLNDLLKQRAAYLAAEKLKASGSTNPRDLDNAIQSILRKQAEQRKFSFVE